MPSLPDAYPVTAARDRDSEDHVLVPALPGAGMTPDVTCVAVGSGWSCDVAVRDGERVVTTHRVRLIAGDLERLDPGAASPEDLVRRSFAFLLEREPPSSILREFDLTVIGRYFPEYESVIRR
jgi:hypothetical protein